MSVPPPGPLADEAVRFAEAMLKRVRGESASELPPELVARFTGAVADVAVAGAGLLQVVAEVAQEWTRPVPGGTPEDPEPPVERIDID